MAELLSREAPSQEGGAGPALLHRPTASSGSGSTRCGAVLDAPPNFPRPTICCFFCGMLKREGSPEALTMVERTLDAMAHGGLQDQIGGGFSRYATDRKWLVPHFEKDAV